MAEVTSKLQVTLPKSLAERQRGRTASKAKARFGKFRGWTREELYDRGSPR